MVLSNFRNLIKKIVFFALILLFFPSFCIGKTTYDSSYLEKIESYMKKSDKKSKYVILDYVDGNFTGSGELETLVFFDKEKQNPEAMDSIKLIKLFIFDNKQRIKKCYEIKTNNIVISKPGAKTVYKGNAFGVRKKVGWFVDFNKDGRLELFLESGYTNFISFRIFEFFDGEFKEIFEFKEEYAEILDILPENKTIYLQRQHWNSERQNYFPVKTKVFWNENKQFYDEETL